MVKKIAGSKLKCTFINLKKKQNNWVSSETYYHQHSVLNKLIYGFLMTSYSYLNWYLFQDWFYSVALLRVHMLVQFHNFFKRALPIQIVKFATFLLLEFALISFANLYFASVFGAHEHAFEHLLLIWLIRANKLSMIHSHMPSSIPN